MNRLEQLQKFYNDDPADPFNLYALALEYQKVDATKSVSHFETLRQTHADYLPTYYQLGKLHDALGNKAEAIAVFEAGIAVARKQNNTKALGELRSALDELVFE